MILNVSKYLFLSHIINTKQFFTYEYQFKILLKLHNYHQLIVSALRKSSTMSFNKPKSNSTKITLEESWDEDEEEIKTNRSKSKKKSKKGNVVIMDEIIEEKSLEESPTKKSMPETPVGSGMQYVSVPQHVPVSAQPHQIIHQVPAQPSFTLGDIQSIVSSTLAQHLKRDVNYLEPQNIASAPMYAQQPQEYQSHKLPIQHFSEEEAKLKAEENEYKKGIAINIAPYAQQTLGIDISRPLNAGYTNPFLGGNAPHTGLNPPQLVNMDDFDISSASELYSEENDYDDFIKKQDSEDAKYPEEFNMGSRK